MSAQELISEAKNLSIRDKSLLITELKKQIRKARRTAVQDECDNLALHYSEPVAAALGVDLIELMTSREKPMPAARALIARKLVKAGYTHSEIARSFGQNHATIYVAIDKAEYALQHPAMFPEYDEIKKILSNV